MQVVLKPCSGSKPKLQVEQGDQLPVPIPAGQREGNAPNLATRFLQEEQIQTHDVGGWLMVVLKSLLNENQ